MVSQHHRLDTVPTGPARGAAPGPDTGQRWRLDFNFLSGLCAGQWWALLRDHELDPDYAHRALFISALSLLNSTQAVADQALYGRRVARVGAVAPPLFVLGHFRQGTTHLHNLLWQDDRLGAPSTYAVLNPRHFLLTERIGSRLFRRLLPAHRPADQVRLGFELPQEDEYALCLMTLASPYLALSFPRDDDRHLRYLAFDGVPEAELEAWKQAFRTFLARCSVRDPRPMVLKSPPHTARVRLLLELFPGARFVHIRRDPYVVFQSMRRLFATSAGYMCLQRPEPEKADARILRGYRLMYEAWLAQKDAIPAGHLVEISCEELEARPLPTLRRVYEGLALGAVPEEAVRRYLAADRGFRKNEHPPLTRAERALVRDAWSLTFEAWGYPTEEHT